MSAIEERIVSMKFQGEQFLAGIDKSLQKLEQFNQKLKMSEGTKGLDNIGKAAGNQSGALSKMADGVQHISDRFKTLGVVGMAALSNITNQAIFAGQNLVKSLTVAPILDGFREYETNLNSIQTILSNTQAAGTKLRDVTAALDELNHYSDQTIYNFSEMAKNIGTFTAAGVGLKPAVAAIKGIANLAALSGSNSQQASAAMYQLSQAISAGRVSLEDWNSVVNAGMGGTVFQRALAQTAVKMGTLDDNAVKLKGSMKNVTIEGKSFRESITAKPGKESWLTSDVLTKTLAQFTGDLTDAQLAAEGFNKAEIEAIQAQAKMAKNAATEVKTLSQLLGTIKESVGSGWSQTWKTIFGDFPEAKKLFTNVNNVVGKMISNSADARNKVLAEWKKLGGRDALFEAIGNGFKALMAVVKPVKEAFRDIFPAVTGKQLAGWSKALRDFTEGLMISGTTANNLKRTFKGFFALFDIGFMVIKEIVGVILDLAGVVTEGSGGFLNFTGNLGDFIVKIRDAIKNGEGLHKVFETIGKVLAVPVRVIKTLIGLIAGVGAKIGGLDISDKLAPMQRIGAVISAAWDKVLGAVDGVWDKMSGFREWVGGFFGDLGGDISSMVSGLKFDDILKGIGTGVFASLILTIRKFFSGNGVGGIVENISEGFENLTGALGAMQNTLRAATLLQIAVAVGILAISMNTLAKIDSAGLARASAAITVMFTQLIASLLVFEKFSGFVGFAKMPFVATSMILLAAAVVVLSSAVKKLADLDWEELAKGLVGTTALLGSLVLVTRFIGNPSGLISTAAGLLVLSAAIKVLVSAVTDLSGLSWEELAKGLVGVGTLLAGLTLFSKFAQVDKGGLLAGAGLLLMAVGIKILASAVEKMSGLSWGEIAKGLATMLGALTIMTAALIAIPPTAPLGAASVLLVAISLQSVATALQSMANMGWGEIGKGLTTMLGALAIISAALIVIPPTAPAGAASILLVALSLGMIGNALQAFSQFSWEEIAKAGVVLAGTLGIIAVAMNLMTGTLAGAAALLVVSASLGILTPVLTTLGAMSWESILKGLVTLAGALTILGIAGALMTPVIPTLIGLGASITLLGAGLALAGVGVFLFATGLTLVAASGVAAAGAIVGMINILLGAVPQIVKLVGNLLVALLDLVIKVAPKMQQAATVLIGSLIKVIVKLTPQINDMILRLLTMLISNLAKYVPRMVDAGTRLLVGLLNGMAKKMNAVVTAATNVVVAFINAVGRNQGRVIEAGVKLVIGFVNGVANSIRAHSGEMQAAGRNLGSAIIQGMVGGISGGIGAITSAARRIASSALSSAKSVLGIHSPSREFFKIGQYVNDGFRKGLDSNRSQIDKSFNYLRDRLKKDMNDSGKDVEALEKKLKKLTHARRKDREEIAETRKALAQARKEHDAYTKAYNEMTKKMGKQHKALDALADKQDMINKKLKDANQKLTDAIKTRDDYNKQIREQYSDVAAPTGEMTATGFITDLKKQIEDTKSFANQLQQLRKLGLNDETYKDLLTQGTSALPFVTDLLKGGKTQIDQINKLNKELDGIGASMGKNASSALYQAAVDSAAGLVKGLEKQQKAIEKQMDKIADAMVKAIKKKLGIKSPSRVFAEVGRFSAEGLSAGLDKHGDLVARTASSVGERAVEAMRISLSNVDKMVSGNIDVQPTIRPVLDLTDIRKNAGKLTTLLPNQAKMSIDGSYAKASTIAAEVRDARDGDGEFTAGGGTFLQYNQTINSPKPVSPVEVYRGTKNQLSTVKGALSTG